jgi:hypothetical protein
VSAFRVSCLLDRGLWIDRADTCPSPVSVQKIQTFPEVTGVLKVLQSEPRWTRSSTWFLNFQSPEPILLIVNADDTFCSSTRSSKMFLCRTHNDTHQRLGFMFFQRISNYSSFLVCRRICFLLTICNLPCVC